MEIDDLLRQAEADLLDAEFRASFGLGDVSEVSVAREAVERYKREISTHCEPCPITFQRELIRRESERRGFDPDSYAETWIAWNSAKFRKMWDR